jgi:hypothetical protein
MNKSIVSTFSLMIFLVLSSVAFADVRVKQRVSMSGQKFESTRSIKGSRERTEQKIQMDDPAAAAYFPQIATITQCDLRRTVKLNDGKQLYFVEPFPTAADTPRTGARRNTDPPPTRSRQGGTMTISYSIRDTGERKMMFGLQARHLIITQEMESSVDSCNGPHKTKMEFDGWYVDFSAEFNCPGNAPSTDMPQSPTRPDCVDRIVTKSSGTAKPGFLLEGTMKMYGEDGTVQMTQMTETLELSRATLDPALFDIPANYREVTNSQDLYSMSMPGPDDMGRRNSDRSEPIRRVPSGSDRMPAEKSVGVSISLGPVGGVNQSDIANYVRGRLAARGLRMVSAGGDYVLSLQVRQIKESTAGKIGGIFGRVTGVDTKAGKVDVDMTASLSGGATGEAKIKGKFDGPPADAVRTAVGQALDELLERIQ